jgi:hypothetical protein
MTWLGKILTFVVMLAAVMWMYFTVQAYATRTNWKTEYEKLKEASVKTAAAQAAEINLHQINEDALKRLLINEQTRTSNVRKELAEAVGANKIANNKVTDLQKAYDENDVKCTLLEASVDGANKEAAAVRERNIALEDKMTGLILAREDALREKVQALNEAKLQKSIAEENSKKVEELALQVSELKLSGGSLRGLLEKPPPPVLSNLRGEVERVAGDLVVLSIGVDAGLSKGSVLDLSRLEGGGRYLGTVKITELYPKQAIAVFTPARANVPFTQLRPEELPKKGDQVRPSESSVSRVISPR